LTSRSEETQEKVPLRSMVGRKVGIVMPVGADKSVKLKTCLLCQNGKLHVWRSTRLAYIIETIFQCVVSNAGLFEKFPYALN